MKKRTHARRGGALVEFAVVLILLLSVIFASLEFDRMLMSYTSLANAARVGVRYAVVHGSNRTNTGDPRIAVADDPVVTGIVKSWARLGFLDPDNLTVSVQTIGGITPGSRVVVTVSYPYAPLTFIPMNVTLRASSRGLIVF